MGHDPTRAAVRVGPGDLAPERPPLARVALALVLLLSLLRGLAWATVVPPLHPNDEAQHLLRVRSLAGQLPLDPPTATDPATVPLDLALLGRLVGMGVVERDRSLRIDLDPARAADLRRRMDDPAARSMGVPDGAARPGDGLGLVRHRAFDDQHPPLFYGLMSLACRALSPLGVGGQVLGLRYVVAALGVAVAWTAWAVGRLLWPGAPGRALALAAVAAFQPTAGFYLSVVNSESLTIVLFGLALLLLARATRGPMRPVGAAVLAATVSAGLLTKVSLLAVLPLCAAVAAWQLVAFGESGDRRRTAISWAVFAAGCAVAAGWWYAPLLIGRGDPVGRFGEASSAAPVGFTEYLWSGRLAGPYGRVVKGEYWGSLLGNGWTRGDAGIPTPAKLAVMAVALGGATLTGGYVGWRARSRRAFVDSPAAPLLVLGAGTVLLAAFFVLLDYRFVARFGSGFRLRGQYLMPGVVGAMAWVVFGAGLLRPRSVRVAALASLAAGSIGLNGWTLLLEVAPRYYGPGLGRLGEAVPLVQPVGAAWVWTVLGLLGATSVASVAALVVVLWRDDGGGPTGLRPVT